MKKTLPSKVEKYPFPSRYGSHSSMVFSRIGKRVICRDEHGLYYTDPERLDNGLADPNRYNEARKR